MRYSVIMESAHEYKEIGRVLGISRHSPGQYGRDTGIFTAFEPVPREMKVEGTWVDNQFHFASEGQPCPFYPPTGIGYLIDSNYGYRWAEQTAELQDMRLCDV